MPQIRQWMFNPDLISLEEHSQFVAGLSQRNDKLYIAFFDRSQLVASYDLVDIHDGNAECGLYLRPDYEGKGIASMVEERMEEIVRERGISALKSQVLADNMTSLHFFLRNGFVEQKRDNGVVYLCKSL